MNLTEYNTICAQMGAYCERAYRQENIDGEIYPRVSACDAETLEGYELELMKEYNTNFSDIKLELDKMKDNAPGVNEVKRYRQNFAIYGTIQALIDDIKANKVYCPQKAQKRLIGSLERLYQMSFSISQMCFAEFDKIKAKGKKSKEKKPLAKIDIVSNPDALNYCCSEKEYLDDNFRIKKDVATTADMTRIAYKLRAILDRSLIDIGKYWGVNERIFRNNKSYNKHK